MYLFLLPAYPQSMNKTSNRVKEEESSILEYLRWPWSLKTLTPADIRVIAIFEFSIILHLLKTEFLLAVSIDTQQTNELTW